MISLMSTGLADAGRNKAVTRLTGKDRKMKTVKLY